MTALVQAEVDGERLTHAEIGAFFVLLAVAGNDTTRHTTSHAMRALTTNPDQRAHLLEDLEGRMPAAVEEFVRWGSAVLTFRRTATRDVELHGTPIAEGQKVVLFYHSANRDETAFADPQRFDLTRDPNHHVGFGGGGPHYCLGASLARTQLRALFTELLTLLPDLEVGEPELVPRRLHPRRAQHGLRLRRARLGPGMAPARDPRVDAYIDALPDWQQDVCRQVRAVVHAADAEIRETIKRTVQPYFVLDGNVCALLAARDHVNVFLYDGAIVPDPDGIITGGHDNATARTVAIRRGEPVPAGPLEAMLRQIVANNRAGGWRTLKRARGAG